MAAEMAVESTAQETDLTEDSQAKAEHSEATVREDHSVKAETVREGHSERAEIVQEDRLEKAQKEEASAENVQEDHSEKTLSAQEEHSVRILREEASAEESRLEEAASTQRRRASTRRISTISVMRMRAESTR